ncbi:hypothetical protein SE17_05785, partial [Kouleothrix aurantiaca]
MEILQTRGQIGPVVAPEIDIESVAKRLGNIEAIKTRVMKTLPEMARAALEDYTSAPSPSEARFRVIGGIMQLPNDEIVAVIHFWADEGKLPWGNFEKKGLAKQTAEILRCIAKHEARMLCKGHPRVTSPTHSADMLPARALTKSRARRDRPQRVDADKLFAYYRQEAHSGVVLISIADVAKAFGTSTSTISRLEDGLVEAGFILPRTRGRLGLRLVAKTINIAALESNPPLAICAKTTNIAAVTDSPNDSLCYPEAKEEPQASMYNHVPPSIHPRNSVSQSEQSGGLSAHTMSLGEAVAVYLDTPVVTDRATGELQRIHNAKRCIAYVESLAPGQWSAGMIRMVYGQVGRARRQDIWRQERAKLRAMQRPDELARHIAAIQLGLVRNIG